MPRATKFTPLAAAQLAPSPESLYAETSGWAYPTWKPRFYTADLPTRAFLYTARKLNTFASQFTALAATQEVFVYFKHEDEPTGALDAVAMLKKASTLSRKAAR